VPVIGVFAGVTRFVPTLCRTATRKRLRAGAHMLLHPAANQTQSSFSRPATAGTTAGSGW
jgi:hypothetical protein